MEGLYFLNKIGHTEYKVFKYFKQNIKIAELVSSDVEIIQDRNNVNFVLPNHWQQDFLVAIYKI